MTGTIAATQFKRAFAVAGVFLALAKFSTAFTSPSLL